MLFLVLIARFECKKNLKLNCYLSQANVWYMPLSLLITVWFTKWKTYPILSFVITHPHWLPRQKWHKNLFHNKSPSKLLISTRKWFIGLQCKMATSILTNFNNHCNCDFNINCSQTKRHTDYIYVWLHFVFHLFMLYITDTDIQI